MKDKRPTKRFAAPARAGRPLRPQQLLILAYAAAVIVWLVYVLVGSAVMLNHKADGTMVTRTLTADDLEFESFVNYDDDEWHTAPVDEPGWYLSTDNDPHISADGESGQHLYDLPDVREDIRRRAEWTPERVDESGGVHWFRRNSRRFLSQHPHCRIVIRDEYGREHPIEGDDT